MSVLMLLEMPGATIEQYEQVNEAMGIGDDANPPEGLVEHVLGVSDDGLIVADVWESEEALGRFVEQRLRPALEKAGVPPGPEARVHPVHNRLEGAGEEANVLLIVEIDEGPDVYDQVTSKMDAHTADGTGHPSTSHTAAKTDAGGVLVVDLWDSPEAFGAFAEEQIGPAAAEAGMGPLEPRFVPVHNRIRGKAA
jgi:heme-degrading monooxygenase HmoA